jgi:hypothetical protein
MKESALMKKMNPAQFRRIALALDGVIEAEHMGHPDFRANGKIFATIHGDSKSGMVKLTPEQQQVFLSEHPDAFEPESGAWGRAGCTKVQFDKVTADVLGNALTSAWQNAQNTKKPKKNR